MTIRDLDGKFLFEDSRNADVEEVDLRRANFAHCEVEVLVLSDADLRGADFTGADLYWTYMYRSNCEGSTFRGARLAGVALEEANLRGVDFRDAYLSYDNLGGATSVEDSDLTGAQLDGADLRGCRYSTQTIFPDGFDPDRSGMVRREENRNKRLAVLLSGRGSNCLAIAKAIAEGRLHGVEIVLVLSNREDAPGLIAAHAMGLRARAIPSAGMKRAEHDALMIKFLQDYRVDLVCLAGYMRIISPEFVAAFPERILNVHPSLLPAFPGLGAQRQALEYGAKVAGCTVHFVDEAVDHGVIVLQRAVAVEDEDTEETLSARILEQEHLAYPKAIARVVSGEYRVEGRRYVRRP
jgi:phosphoribosylglycinamide formyltransferase-1